jgi:type II secretory pathway pseudopilin PulG
MSAWMTARRSVASSAARRTVVEQGFSLVEFLVSSLIVLVMATSVFGLLSHMQRAGSYQAEVQGVLENTRLAVETIERILEQAGNDPLGAGFPGIAITSATQVRVRSDLTGSAGPGSPDKGDPDGDTDDANEDVTIRFNASALSIELVPAGGTAQPVASNISAFTMQYFGGDGVPAGTGNDVRRIRFLLTGTSPLPDPQTRRIFSMQLCSDVQLIARR